MKLVSLAPLFFLFNIGSVYATDYMAKCWLENETKYDAETCLEDLVLDRERKITLLQAKLNVHALEIQDYDPLGAFKGVIEDLAKEQNLYTVFLNAHCDNLVNFKTSGMSSGSSLYSECRINLLDQRVITLNEFLEVFK